MRFIELTRYDGRKQTFNAQQVNSFRPLSDSEKINEPNCNLWLDGGYFQEKYAKVKKFICGKETVK